MHLCSFQTFFSCLQVPVPLCLHLSHALWSNCRLGSPPNTTACKKSATHLRLIPPFYLTDSPLAGAPLRLACRTRATCAAVAAACPAAASACNIHGSKTPTHKLLQCTIGWHVYKLTWACTLLPADTRAGRRAGIYQGKHTFGASTSEHQTKSNAYVQSHSDFTNGYSLPPSYKQLRSWRIMTPLHLWPSSNCHVHNWQLNSNSCLYYLPP